MKSPQVTKADFVPDKDCYSELKVLRSNAGYYVGTEFWDSEYGFWSPGSRDSGYFDTEDKAAKYLAMIEADSKPEQHLRLHPAEGTAWDDGHL